MRETQTTGKKRPVTGSTLSSATAEQPIGFVDSGVGGLPYLQRARELLPEERFVYLADRQHFPYGVRTRDEIHAVVIGAVSELVRAAQPKMVVVACNTASVVSLSELRTTFSIPFVGVVPAIKPAGAAVKEGRIGVLATERTVEDPYVSSLVREFAPDSGLVLAAAGQLVEIIETRLTVASREEILAALRVPVEELNAESVDAVVLGCTHFVHVRGELSRMLGDKIPVLDSLEGVARQIVRVCEHIGRAGRAPHGVPGREERDLLLVSGGKPLEDSGEAADENYRRLAAKFNLELLDHQPVDQDR